MWILILSIVANGNGVRSGAGVNAQQMQFQSYAACAKAGEIIQNQHRGERGAYVSVRWSCVKDR